MLLLQYNGDGIMRSKIHSILIAFCVPVMMGLILPTLKIGVQDLLSTALRRGDYGLYFVTDIALSLIFAFCICYLTWCIQ